MTKRTQKIILLGILIASFAVRVYRLNIPASYYFDEVYHAVTAKAYATNNPAGYEWWHPAPEPDTAYEWLHPPIAKLFMAVGIKLLGVHAYAWRFPGVLFGVGVIYATYLFAFEVSKKRSIALLAAFFASLDGLLIAQSRIGMNDIYVTLFIVLAGLYYLKWLKSQTKNHLLILGCMVGLAIATKWSGIFLLGMVGGMELLLLASKKIGFDINRYVKLFTVLIVMPLVIYILSYGQFFLQGHTISQFKELHRQIFWYQFHLEATHPYQSAAWQWPILIRPVWQSVDYSIPGKVSNIYAMGNPLISWFGFGAAIWLTISTVRQRKRLLISSTLPLIMYFGVWVPWILSPRIMFYYHYTPAVPFLCILLALAVRKLYKFSPTGQIFSVNIISMIVLVFVLFYPHWVGMPIPKYYSDWLFWFSSWR